MNAEFWEYLQNLVDHSLIVIDRPKGSLHPSYPGQAYRLDYGLLRDTTSADGCEIDIWSGSMEEKRVVGVLCTVDLLKRDAELKILIGCTEDEIGRIGTFVNQDQMRAITIKHND